MNHAQLRRQGAHMSVNLGPHQKAVLRALKERGQWHRGCGWFYDTRSRTVRILEALVARDLVVKTKREAPFTAPIDAYRLQENKS
jgi:hypothetical protein